MTEALLDPPHILTETEVASQGGMVTEYTVRYRVLNEFREFIFNIFQFNGFNVL